jgi:hypothetical protein
VAYYVDSTSVVTDGLPTTKPDGVTALDANDEGRIAYVTFHAALFTFAYSGSAWVMLAGPDVGRIEWFAKDPNFGLTGNSRLWIPCDGTTPSVTDATFPALTWHLLGTQHGTAYLPVITGDRGIVGVGSGATRKPDPTNSNADTGYNYRAADIGPHFHKATTNLVATPTSTHTHTIAHGHGFAAVAYGAGGAGSTNIPGCLVCTLHPSDAALLSFTYGSVTTSGGLKFGIMDAPIGTLSGAPSAAETITMSGKTEDNKYADDPRNAGTATHGPDVALIAYIHT